MGQGISGRKMERKNTGQLEFPDQLKNRWLSPVFTGNMGQGISGRKMERKNTGQLEFPDQLKNRWLSPVFNASPTQIQKLICMLSPDIHLPHIQSFFLTTLYIYCRLKVNGPIEASLPPVRIIVKTPPIINIAMAPTKPPIQYHHVESGKISVKKEELIIHPEI